MCNRKVCFFACISVLCFASCIRKKDGIPQDSRAIQQEGGDAAHEHLGKMEAKESGAASAAEPQQVQPEEMRFSIKKMHGDYFGTTAEAVVNDDDVNVRLLPDVSLERISQLHKGDVVEVKGFSDRRELIDGYNGYWLKIAVQEEVDKSYYRDNFGNFGWVFSKYVDVPPEAEVSTFSVKEFVPAAERKVSSLKLELTRWNEKKEVRVYPRKIKGQDFCTFVWSDDIEDFMYCDPVGTFKWFPETNEIRHATYMGYDCESAWSLISDGDTYLFQDGGTSPGIRGLRIYEIASQKMIFSGSYLRDLDYDGTSVIVVERCDEWSMSQKWVSEESVAYAEAYKKQLPAEELKDKSIVVRYRFHLETQEKTYLDCTTVYEQ